VSGELWKVVLIQHDGTRRDLVRDCPTREAATTVAAIGNSEPSPEWVRLEVEKQ
jgi:hypothetical protein